MSYLYKRDPSSIARVTLPIFPHNPFNTVRPVRPFSLAIELKTIAATRELSADTMSPFCTAFRETAVVFIMTNRCIRIYFNASDKFHLTTRHLSFFWLCEKRILLPAIRRAKLQGSGSYKESVIQECKDSRSGDPGDLNIPEYEHSWRTALARLQIADFYLLAFSLCRCHVAPRSRFIATLLFLRNKYVSRGKQEAISTGLADQAIPAIPWTRTAGTRC